MSKLITNMRNVRPLPKYKFKQLNNLLASGYFTRIPVPNDSVWGISSFESADGCIEVKAITGRFLGGGIHENYGYKVRLGDNRFWCKNFHYALRCVHGYLTKHNYRVLLTGGKNGN